MRFLEFKHHFQPFGVVSIEDIRKVEPKFDLRRLVEWQKKQYIRKIVRGDYIFGDVDMDERMLFLAANVIYEPSYVSLETMLHFYGLTPEAVYTVTCVSTRKTEVFDTPVGRFSYRSIKREAYFGYYLMVSDNRELRVAEAEKAVLDFLYLNPKYDDEAAFAQWRLNMAGFIQQIDREKLRRYMTLFTNRALSLRVNKLLTFIDRHAES